MGLDGTKIHFQTNYTTNPTECRVPSVRRVSVTRPTLDGHSTDTRHSALGGIGGVEGPAQEGKPWNSKFPWKTLIRR